MLIIDNTVIAYEHFHFMNHKGHSSEDFASVKLDMAKVYDWIEWAFLKNTMLVMGFPSRC